MYSRPLQEFYGAMESFMRRTVAKYLGGGTLNSTERKLIEMLVEMIEEFDIKQEVDE